MTSDGDPGRADHEVARPSEKETVMGMDDKIKNTAQDLTGKGKEAVGKATDNERLEAEGEKDQAAANLKQAGENVKDTFR
jgi:uncharacterized protein YjbJ (UPF0337 family)